MTRLVLIAIVGFAAVASINGFVFPSINQCVLSGAQSTTEMNCYTACPTNTVEVQIACPSGEICCEGTPVCQSVECNNGTCVYDGTVESCECDDGYSGEFCQFDACDELNRTCGPQTLRCNRLPPPDVFNCTCNPGWSGSNCLIDECAELGCVNGSCTALSEAPYAECACEDGFSGLQCDVDACSPNPCVHGSCNRETGGTHTCTCEEPYFGDDCTEQICDGLPCENGGTCTSNTATTYTCECPDEFKEENCSIPVCQGDSSECNFNGTCDPIGGGAFECVCDPGFSGTFCDNAELACGIEQSTRLFGGLNDERHKNPFVVRIGRGTTTFCTGVLIEKQYVITDIVCALLAQQGDNLPDVIVGDFNVTETDDTEVHYAIEEITTDAPYSTLDDLTDADAALGYIAVLKLNDTVTKGYAINNACPPKTFDVFDPNCKIAAYGGTVDAFPGSPALYRQTLPFSPLNDRVCGLIRGSEFPEKSGCGYSLIDGTGICIGDHGGAVVCQDDDTLQWHLQGIISYRTNPDGDRLYCSDEFIYYADMADLWSYVQGVIDA